MKICIDAQSVQKEIKGIGYYTLNLIKALAVVDPSNEYYLYCRKRFFDGKRNLPELPAKNFKLIIDRFGRSAYKCVNSVDVFHTSDASTVRPRCQKFVLTIHDVINKTYPADRSSEDLQKQDRDLKRVVREADLILTDAESTKRDILQYYSVSRDKIKTLYPGINTEIFLLLPDKKAEIKFHNKYQIKKKYILFVGTIEPRKNIDNIIEAYNIMDGHFKEDYQLIFVGSGDAYLNKMQQKAKALNLQGQIIFTNYIPREDLNYFYNYCRLFVYPSHYEGFGFPILEAMSCAKPVITSNISSCKEIVLDNAIVVDPDSVEQIKESMEHILLDEGLYKSYSAASKKRSESFSWKSTAETFLRYINE